MSELETLRAVVERVREIHKPKSTRRTEYVLDERGGITGTAPTFTCPEGCMASAWFFEGQGCDTYKALDEAPEPNQNETKPGQEFCFTEAQVEAAAIERP